MKLTLNISNRAAGASLLECLVYIAVFGILLNLAAAAFYFCWDHTRAVIYESSDIESALHAGECWRTDVRLATGNIFVENTSAGEVTIIPEGRKKISYRFAGGELRRQVNRENVTQLLLSKVKASQMQADPRGNVTAWRWELQLVERRRETQIPLMFTFEAVDKNTP